MMLNEEWSIFAKVATLPEAEVIKLLLESENVETDIHPVDSINPHAGVYLLVESDLVHRAIWIIKNKGTTDDELDFLATGELHKEN
ncbi:MAG: hypothetical protein ACYC69_15955 [Thermodesulfovibrionales bacterium]